ncbi:MAG TPA: CPBP family intramembrane glutamic endopeptidase [Lacipirellulaceae bacterium]|nr:CPBP family intramembrane glutamic endopeptidase [Lacipirellulaceae bacterium]
MVSPTFTPRFALSWFFLLAFAWTWLCWWTLYAATLGYVTLPIPHEHLATLGQFGPFAAALMVTTVTIGRSGVRELLLSLVRWRAHPRWPVISLLLLPATMIAAMVIYSFVKNGSLAGLQFRASWSTLPRDFVYLLILGGALGEEPGWRGFALPRMQARYGPLAASVCLGLLHAVWHLPLWWLYPPPCPFPVYVAGVIPMTVLFTWLWNHTRGSVFYSLIFHASLSTASVRLPEVPAYSIWVLLLWSLALVLLLYDRQLGYRGLVLPPSRG